MLRVNNLPYKIEVGTVFSHNQKSKFFNVAYTYEIKEIKLGGEGYNDQVTIHLLNLEGWDEAIKEPFKVEPMWFKERKIKILN